MDAGRSIGGWMMRCVDSACRRRCCGRE